MKHYKVILSPTFIQMLKYELKYCARINTSYARKIENKVFDAIRILKIFPYATPIIKLRGDPETYRKYVVKKKFIIIFQIYTDSVQLEYFIDARQSLKNYFKLFKD